MQRRGTGSLLPINTCSHCPCTHVHKRLCAQTHFPPLHFCFSLFSPSLSTLSLASPLTGQIPKVGIPWSENSNMFKFFTAMLNCFSKMLYIYPPTIHGEKSSWSTFCASFDRRKLAVQLQEHPTSTVTVTASLHPQAGPLRHLEVRLIYLTVDPSAWQFPFQLCL